MKFFKDNTIVPVGSIGWKIKKYHELRGLTQKQLGMLCGFIAVQTAGNDYNLSVSIYVEAEDTREKVDIRKLNAEIREIVSREQTLREEIDKIIAEIEGGQEV